MRTSVFAGFIAFALVNVAFAKLDPLPPSASGDGIAVHAAGANYSTWTNSSLNDFRDPNCPGSAAVVWGDNAPTLGNLCATGGTIQLVFLDAGSWDGSVGYTRSGTIRDHAYTLDSASALSFGDSANFFFPIHEANSFDVWVTGGLNTFCLFNPTNSEIETTGTSVKWTQSPLVVHTYIPGMDTYADVETWIATVEENDGPLPLSYRIAVQFFPFEGSPTDSVPVPEPSSFGIAGGLLLLGAVLLKRRYLARH